MESSPGDVLRLLRRASCALSMSGSCIGNVDGEWEMKANARFSTGEAVTGVGRATVAGVGNLFNSNEPREGRRTGVFIGVVRGDAGALLCFGELSSEDRGGSKGESVKGLMAMDIAFNGGRTKECSWCWWLWACASITCGLRPFYVRLLMDLPRAHFSPSSTRSDYSRRARRVNFIDASRVW